jgi:dTMP kinase
MTTKGCVIAIDGPDGAGKTTQVKLLAQHLENQGKIVHITRSSGGTPVGEALRKVSLSLIPRPPETDFYISLAMAAALANDIAARKKLGETIIIDRSPLAWVAYNAYGSELENKQMVLEACVEWIANWQIDYLFFMDAPTQALNKRRKLRATKDYYEAKDAPYHKRVFEGYKTAIKYVERHSEIEVININAEQPVSDIQAQIISLVQPTNTISAASN